MLYLMKIVVETTMAHEILKPISFTRFGWQNPYLWEGKLNALAGTEVSSK